MLKDWLNINSDLFHFLRPEYLWLFIPMLIILVIAIFSYKAKNSWEKVIARHLRPFVIGRGSKFALLAPLVMYVIISSLLIFSASGPTWEKRNVPGEKSQAILLIGLDLSMSMLVEDVSPNRVDRAKLKIRELLESDPGTQVGLFVYAGTPHPVITPSSDYKLLNYQLESLTPRIMPLPGTNLELALQLADSMFSGIEAPSTLLLITDNIESHEAGAIKGFVNNSNNNLELMTMASLNGGPIPGFKKGTYFKENGENVISALDQNVLFDLQKEAKINVNPLSLDNSDVESIASKVKSNIDFRAMDEESDEDWKEFGYSIVIIIAILFVLWFRKGWMIHMSLILFLTSCSSNNSEVNNWDDLWYTKDYQGQMKMDEGNYLEAADEYTSLSHKGTAYYLAGDYESAIQLFSQDSSASSLYNLGIAYAANGEYENAQEALVLAQELDPDNDRIKQSLKKNQLIITEIDSLHAMNPEDAITLKDKKKKEPLVERKAKGKDEELSSDTEAKELPKDGERVTDEVESGERTAKELEMPPEDFMPQVSESADNVLLREISAEPSEFLRRRFKYQYTKYYQHIEKPLKPW